MNVSTILIGRRGSRLKDKNIRSVLGRPLCSYPMLAARNSKYVNDLYISTDCPEIIKIGSEFGAKFVERRPEMATDQALAEDVFKFCFLEINKINPPDIIVLLFANGATITPGIIDQGISFLIENPDFDSAVTVSKFNMFSPLRARKIDDGKVLPFIPPTYFPMANCDRDSQGDTFFADCSAFIVRPRCFDYSLGEIPFKWIGKKVAPLYQEVGCDVDFEWQFPVVEYALKTYGFTDKSTPYLETKQFNVTTTAK